MDNGSCCPVLTIPTELRLVIYVLVLRSFDDRALFIDEIRTPSSRRLKSSLLLPDRFDNTDQARITKLQNLDVAAYLRLYSRNPHDNVQGLTWYPARDPYDSYSTAILRTCRRINFEACNLPFTLNTFHFSSIAALNRFALTVPHSHSKGLRSIALIPLWPSATVFGMGAESEITLAEMRDCLAGVKDLMLFVKLHEVELGNLEDRLPLLRGLASENVKVGFFMEKLSDGLLRRGIRSDEREFWRQRLEWAAEFEREMKKPAEACGEWPCR